MMTDDGEEDDYAVVGVAADSADASLEGYTAGACDGDGSWYWSWFPQSPIPLKSYRHTATAATATTTAAPTPTTALQP